ncbi:hypothetical protein OG389_20140 [Streptomyces sp. NBC_00435]|uniref:hypothetical protein n=1 Tax=Streptomyces sp. NBC_00435 TaxID=2903649 RepID=UPI002E212E76
MSGTRRVLTARSRALRASLTVLCVVLLCVFGAGPSGPSLATAEGSRSAPAAPAEPTEGPADPAGDPEVRLAVRVPARGIPGVGDLRRPVFHVKHPGSGEPAPRAAGASTTAAPLRALRSVVLRC